MINYFIPILGSYFNSGLISYFLFPMICLGLLYVFPSFVKSFFSWR